jgi:hypothetical protein
MMDRKTLEARFSPARLALLLRNRAFDEAAVAGIGAAAILALNLLGLLLSRAAFFNSPRAEGRLWISTIFLAGILLAGQAFRGMHDGKAGTDWVLLPATPLEKYLAGLLDCAVLFPVAAALAGMALSALLSLVERAVGGPGGAIWTPFGAEALRAWADYSVAATVIAAGSAAFRKAALLKTAALATAFGLALGLLAALGLWALHEGGNGAISVFAFRGGRFGIDGQGVSAGARGFVQALYDIGRYAMLPAFAILFGAAKVAEKESRDEVQ